MKNFDNADLQILAAEQLQNKKIGFQCFEIFPSSPEEKEMNKKLNFDRQKETDLADQYDGYHHTKYEKSNELGYCSLPVLHFLYGKLWDNMAENFLATLRPSCVRVSSGSVTCDARLWRVTVFLEKDNRTIKSITQEVEVGLTGCRYGADLACYADGKEINKTSGSCVINTNAIKKMNLYEK